MNGVCTILSPQSLGEHNEYVNTAIVHDMTLSKQPPNRGMCAKIGLKPHPKSMLDVVCNMCKCNQWRQGVDMMHSATTGSK